MQKCDMCGSEDILETLPSQTHVVNVCPDCKIEVEEMNENWHLIMKTAREKAREFGLLID